MFTDEGQTVGIVLINTDTTLHLFIRDTFLCNGVLFHRFHKKLLQELCDVRACNLQAEIASMSMRLPWTTK